MGRTRINKLYRGPRWLERTFVVSPTTSYANKHPLRFIITRDRFRITALRICTYVYLYNRVLSSRSSIGKTSFILPSTSISSSSSSSSSFSSSCSYSSLSRFPVFSSVCVRVQRKSTCRRRRVSRTFETFSCAWFVRSELGLSREARFHEYGLRVRV